MPPMDSFQILLNLSWGCSPCLHVGKEEIFKPLMISEGNLKDWDVSYISWLWKIPMLTYKESSLLLLQIKDFNTDVESAWTKLISIHGVIRSQNLEQNLEIIKYNLLILLEFREIENHLMEKKGLQSGSLNSYPLTFLLISLTALLFISCITTKLIVLICFSLKETLSNLSLKMVVFCF